MTPNERALLLAVANHMWPPEMRSFPNVLTDLIAAVEAEAAPVPSEPERSCETCLWYRECRSTTCKEGWTEWQPKPSVCPTCNGERGEWLGDRVFWYCPDCGGTGRK